MEKLTYVKCDGDDNTLCVDLHNGYSIIARKMWDRSVGKYNVDYRLMCNSIDRWDKINTDRKFTYQADYRTINSAILKEIATLLDEGFFDPYIETYEEELRASAMGMDILDQRRLK